VSLYVVQTIGWILARILNESFGDSKLADGSIHFENCCLATGDYIGWVMSIAVRCRMYQRAGKLVLESITY